ncbi:MAG: heavy metal response regulator transcription factor [Acidobacteriota bacterium]
MKVLVIEDEEKTASYLKKGLSEQGFTVDLSRDGEDGLHLATQRSYDLLIVDILLPRREGWWVLSELKRAGNKTPVLILSALGTVAEKVRGLGLGADDYLVKPFAFSELVARIHSISRRSPTRQPQVIRIADLQLDLLGHKASRNGTALDLTPKEFSLLSLLARHPGEVFSRTLIAEQVWDVNFDTGSNVVDVHIRRLRSKVDDPFEKKLIHTRRGLGYVLEEP